MLLYSTVMKREVVETRLKHFLSKQILENNYHRLKLAPYLKAV